MHNVTVKPRILKTIQLMPARIQQNLAFLVEDLRDRGPVRADWPNFSKIGHDRYHCHLSHKWVACWKCEKNSIEIEVYYAGSRENAPY